MLLSLMGVRLMGTQAPSKTIHKVNVCVIEKTARITSCFFGKSKQRHRHMKPEAGFKSIGETFETGLDGWH
jgi:hypothetical protein